MLRHGKLVTVGSPVGDKVELAQEFFQEMSAVLRTAGAALNSKEDIPVRDRQEYARLWLLDMGAVERMINSFMVFPGVRVTYTVAEQLPLTRYAVNSLDMVSAVDAHDVEAGHQLTVPEALIELSTIQDLATASLRPLGIDQLKLFGTIPFRSPEHSGRVTTADLAVDIAKQPDRTTNGFVVEEAA